MSWMALFNVPRKTVDNAGGWLRQYISSLNLSKKIMILERGLGYNVWTVPDRIKLLQLHGKAQEGGRTSLIEEGLEDWPVRCTKESSRVGGVSCFSYSTSIGASANADSLKR